MAKQDTKSKKKSDLRKAASSPSALGALALVGGLALGALFFGRKPMQSSGSDEAEQGLIVPDTSDEIDAEFASSDAIGAAAGTMIDPQLAAMGTPSTMPVDAGMDYTGGNDVDMAVDYVPGSDHDAGIAPASAS